ncbi:MAG: sigma-70 family RNA polymerase sigma factor [Myxococcota bacterium]
MVEGPTADDVRIDALLRGDRAAFLALVDAHHATMIRVASAMVPSRAIAEEVVQETWMAVLQGLPRFERRSSLRTWIFRILVNRARTRGTREARFTPLSAFGADDDGAPIDADRFDERGYWRTPPDRWAVTPEQIAGDHELLDLVNTALDTLPERQRVVLMLRDVNGWSSDEVRNALELTETNQRVLLHRARAKVRSFVEQHLQERR